MVSATPRLLYPQERYPVPIVQEAGWAPGLLWTGEENLISTRIQSLDHPAHSKLLYRLCCPRHFLLSRTFPHLCYWDCMNYLQVYILQSNNGMDSCSVIVFWFQFTEDGGNQLLVCAQKASFKESSPSTNSRNYTAGESYWHISSCLHCRSCST